MLQIILLVPHSNGVGPDAIVENWRCLLQWQVVDNCGRYKRIYTMLTFVNRSEHLASDRRHEWMHSFIELLVT